MTRLRGTIAIKNVERHYIRRKSVSRQHAFIEKPVKQVITGPSHSRILIAFFGWGLKPGQAVNVLIRNFSGNSSLSNTATL
jgi:hypothetical protein